MTEMAPLCLDFQVQQVIKPILLLGFCLIANLNHDFGISHDRFASSIHYFLEILSTCGHYFLVGHYFTQNIFKQFMFEMLSSLITACLQSKAVLPHIE